MALRSLTRIFRREQRSLFSDILDWMLTPLLFIWPISLVLTWLVAESVANKPFDRALEFNVQVMAQVVNVQRIAKPSTGPYSLRTTVNFPASARELLRAGDADFVYFQVLGTRGEFVVGERDFPLPASDEPVQLGIPKLRDDQLRGEELRVAYMWVQTPFDGAQPILIQVGETREKRATLATEIIKGVMFPQFVTLPLAVLLVWFALERGIRPLAALERRIRKRKPDDLSPIELQEIPTEISPLVVTFNELLQRQKEAIETQKRFLADAAHQLKTPLAGMRMQAELALRPSQSAEEIRRSIQQVGEASARATHTVNQLLSLARSELAGDVVPLRAVSLPSVAAAVVLDCLQRAMDKRIDLGYEGPDPQAPMDPSSSAVLQVAANETLLIELVRNLVENAVTYTPSGGVVTARVVAGSAHHGPAIHVEDTGPGISIEDREHVFEPFFRVLGHGAEGSGLGLSIVREIAQLHGATVRIETAHPQRDLHAQGTRFVVQFPDTPRPAPPPPRSLGPFD